MATTTRRTSRAATPARCRAALRRAIAEGVQVRQLGRVRKPCSPVAGLEVPPDLAHSGDASLAPVA